jgi:hypothetical protein
MANKDKMLNLPWQIGREFTVKLTLVNLNLEKNVQNVRP